MRIIRNEKGLTLLELLVVLVIMGFMVAAIAPRLGGVMGSAIDTMCDTNNKGVREFVLEWQGIPDAGNAGYLPNRLTTVINGDNALQGVVPANIVMPQVDNRIPNDDAETLCHELIARNKLYLHWLSVDEADELIGMGISQLMVLNDADGSDAQTFTGTPMELHNVMTGLGVLMIGAGNEGDMAGTGVWGAGDSDMAGNYSAYDVDVAAMTTVAAPSGLNDDHGNPYWMYRIVAGVGPDCQLVTDGIIMNAALCPGGLTNTSNVVYNNYLMILPKLQSTIDDLGGSGLPKDITVTGVDTGEVKDWNFTEADEIFMFEATCPEGHKWPDNEEDVWSIASNSVF